jgi:hypothetical protein
VKEENKSDTDSTKVLKAKLAALKALVLRRRAKSAALHKDSEEYPSVSSAGPSGGDYDEEASSIDNYMHRASCWALLANAFDAMEKRNTKAWKRLKAALIE